MGRRVHYGWPLLMGVLVAAALLPMKLGSSRARADDQFRAYLPFSWRAVDRDELPTPVSMPSATIGPTSVPSPTATLAEMTPTEPGTPASTEEPTATATEPATPTPTIPAGGSIAGHLLVDDDPAPIGLGFDFGPALYLRKCTAGGADCTIVDRTGVADAEGKYAFAGPAPLAAGEFYQILWLNEDNPPEMLGDLAYLGTWYGPRITKYEAGDELGGFDFEIADIKLVGPSNGTSFGFQGAPELQFDWQRRKSEIGQFTYRWGICSADSGCCQSVVPRQTAWLTGSLGQNSKWVMTSYPPNVKIGSRQDPFQYPYCWFIRVQSEEEYTYGESFYIRKIWFYSAFLALGRLGLVKASDWGAFAPVR